MKEELEIGQVLWLKVRYQIDVISQVKHPMLIAKVENDYIEVIALDKTAGKMHNVYPKNNKQQNANQTKNKVSEAIAALQVLGYNKKEIEKAINTLDKNELSTEELIKKGLTLLGK